MGEDLQFSCSLRVGRALQWAGADVSYTRIADTQLVCGNVDAISGRR